MFKTDEITRAKLAVILIDVLDIPKDEFTMEHLDALAACARDQFVNVDPNTRVRLKDVVACKVVTDVPVPRGHTAVSMFVSGCAVPVDAIVPTEVAAAMFNDITGRQITDADREMLKMYRPLEVLRMRIGEAYAAMVEHKAEAAINGVLESPVVQERATELAKELDKAYQDLKEAQFAQRKPRMQ